MNNLGVLHLASGRYDQGSELLTTALEILREVSGDEHPQTLQTFVNAGIVRYRLGEFEDAIEIMEEALELHERIRGRNHASTLSVANSLAAMYARVGREEERERILTETLAAQRETLGENHFDTLITRMNLAKVRYDREEYAAAEPEYAEIVAKFEQHYPEHFIGAIVRTMQGRCFMEMEQYQEAETAFTEAYTKLTTIFDATHNDAREVARTLADLYTRLDRPEDAARWKAASEAQPPTQTPDGDG
jgi:tetratricopeptide (TPR) repeat protein